MESIIVPNLDNIDKRIRLFVAQRKAVNEENLPERVLAVRVKMFNTMKEQLKQDHKTLLDYACYDAHLEAGTF